MCKTMFYRLTSLPNPPNTVLRNCSKQKKRG